MSNPPTYFKLNKQIGDVEKLFAVLQQQEAAFLEETRTTYDFYHIAGRQDTYARIETQEISAVVQRLYMTIKKDKEIYADICPTGVYFRDEGTLQITSKTEGEGMLSVLWYLYTHSKIRVSLLFIYENIDIHVHLRYDETWKTYIEGRIELASLENDTVEPFFDRLDENLKG